MEGRGRKIRKWDWELLCTAERKEDSEGMYWKVNSWTRWFLCGLPLNFNPVMLMENTVSFIWKPVQLSGSPLPCQPELSWQLPCKGGAIRICHRGSKRLSSQSWSGISHSGFFWQFYLFIPWISTSRLSPSCLPFPISSAIPLGINQTISLQNSKYRPSRTVLSSSHCIWAL